MKNIDIGINTIPSTGSTILDKTLGLVKIIRETNIKNGDTIELTNVVLRLEGMDALSEKLALAKYFDENQLKQWKVKERQETYHYKMLEFGLLQKIEFNQFYFKENFRGSRKLMVHSEDCISTVQLLIREVLMPIEVSIHMRSSNVEKLLPVDLFHLLMSIDYAMYELFLNKKIKEKPIGYNFTVLIGSAHIYPAGDVRRNNE